MGRIEKGARKRKGTNLSFLYLRYLAVMLGGILAAGFVLLVGFSLLVSFGQVLPANYAEKKIAEAEDTLRCADRITKEMIPPLCQYVVFDRTGKVADTDMAEEDVEAAWALVSEEKTKNTIYFYKVIERADGYCVLQYRLVPQYSSAFWREHFIPPQPLLFMLTFLMVFVIILLSSLRFGKKMKAGLRPLMDVVEKVKERELSCEVSYSGIREFDSVISSMDEMKGALKESLEAKWSAEQEKSRQMSALAHDIKTPLTVVRGNAELLAETGLTEEQKSYTDYIVNSALQMQSYVETLIEVTKSAEGFHFQPVSLRVETLLQEIRNQSMGLSGVHKCRVIWKESCHSESMEGVFAQIVRAVINIVTNAMEHTPEGSAVEITAEEKEQKLIFTVEDNGKGFSAEALRHGAEQFFMEDASRSGLLHYGIGLFAAKTIAESHGGELILANSAKTGGGMVRITFPCHLE